MPAACRSCKTSVYWMETTNGKTVPVEASSASPQDRVFNPAKGHVNHFANCPQKEIWDARNKGRR